MNFIGQIKGVKGLLPGFQMILALCIMPAVVLMPTAPVLCKTLFSSQSFTLEAKTLAVLASDLDNKGAGEIIVIKKTGHFPAEKRWISIYRTDATFNYRPKPDQEWEADPDAAVFEVGDVAPSPGKEIVFLTSKGIRYYAADKNGRYAKVSQPLADTPTSFVFPAGGLLPKSKLISDWRGNGGKMIMVPKLGTFAFFGRKPGGEWYLQNNISTTPMTFVHTDQEDDGILRRFSMRMDYRFPRIFSQDFNGDGRTDLLLTQQDTLEVHLQDQDGHFSRQPSVSLTIPGRPADKPVDWDISLLATPADLNNDGFSDMILTIGQGAGGFLERKTDVLVFIHQQQLKNPYNDKPNQVISFFGITPGICLKDLNKDGLKDLVFSSIRLGFWHTVKNLISKKVNVHTAVYFFQKERLFKTTPEFETRSTYNLDLTHGVQFNGGWPGVAGDFDASGYPDLLIARDNKITIYQTGKDQALFSESHRQTDLVTCQFRLIFDLDRDGLDDLIFYEKKRNATISILLNKGHWQKS